ncbi:hypothetical protein VIBNISFn118_550003 [Vibrio nigripulchritudo SFn118]|nr:hypothetical protein VIBNISFn118_550003 [Vibrio nigripulchritudo SFn118]
MIVGNCNLSPKNKQPDDEQTYDWVVLTILHKGFHHDLIFKRDLL